MREVQGVRGNWSHLSFGRASCFCLGQHQSVSRNDDLLECYQIACECLDDEDDTDSILVGAVIMAALYVGPNIVRLANFTGMSRKFVREISLNLRAAGIWDRNTMHLDQIFDKDTGRIGFVLTVLAAQGKVVLSSSDPDTPASKWGWKARQ